MIGEDAISGNLAYVSDYTGFSGDPELQSGNYLALHFEATGNATITVTLTGTVTLTDDGIIVLRIADKDTQVITVTATDGTTTVTKTYSLTGLVCADS